MSAVPGAIQSPKPGSAPGREQPRALAPRLLYLRPPGAVHGELPRAIGPPGGRPAAGRTPCLLSPLPADSGIHRRAGWLGTPGHRLTPPPAPPGQVPLA
jgi:hypothetical protein